MISQKAQLPNVNDQSSRPDPGPDIDQATHGPDHEGPEHSEVRVGDDEIGEVRRLLDRAQGLGRALEAPEQIHDRAHDQELGWEVLPERAQRPFMVPKKFTSTVHTGMISSMEVTMAMVSAQSAIGL